MTILPQPDLNRVNDTLRTHYWSWILRDTTDGPQRLLALLQERLPHIPAHSWPERFNFGGIYVNGLEALNDQDLPLPVRVEYYEPKFEIASASSLFPVFKEEYLLFCDGAIAVAYKPPHLSSMPAKEQRHFSLKASLEKHLNCTIHMPSRLDVSAQGLVVVSILPSAHANLQRAFETRTVNKTYRFATRNDCPFRTHVVEFRIARSPEHAVLRIPSLSEGQSARTELKFSHSHETQQGTLHVITAHPITGRTHQIRVHAAASTLPIVGDNFYGGAPSDYLHLVSCAISLPHPVTGAQVEIRLPTHLSPDWVWEP